MYEKIKINVVDIIYKMVLACDEKIRRNGKNGYIWIMANMNDEWEWVRGRV